MAYPWPILRTTPRLTSMTNYVTISRQSVRGLRAPQPTNVARRFPAAPPWYTCVPSTCSASNSAYATSAFPLEYKWVRLTLKSNNSTAYAVDGNGTHTFPVCWNGKSEAVTAGGPLSVTTQCANLSPVATPVYLVTAMAVMPNGARRVVQQELAEPPSGTLPGGMFARGTWLRSSRAT